MRISLRDAILRHLGPKLGAALADPNVTEIYSVEGDRRVWLDTRDRGRRPTEVRLSGSQVAMVLNSVATATGQRFGPEAPMLAAELPDRLGRIQGFRPPVSLEPVFILRKPAPAVIALDELERSGFVTHDAAERLRWALVEHETLLIVGGTGTGKTTFLNSLLGELAALCPDERIAVLEDTPELACSSADRLSLRTSNGIGLYDLLDSVLRASPHRIVVGEVRDASALPMLDAWNTGHPGGLGTLHANSCEHALLRLATLVQRAGVPSQNSLIAATVALIVRLEGSNAHGRRVAEIAAVRGYDAAADSWLLHSLYDTTVHERSGS
jgi:type IV secretion system protein VirB11